MSPCPRPSITRSTVMSVSFVTRSMRALRGMLFEDLVGFALDVAVNDESDNDNDRDEAADDDHEPGVHRRCVVVRPGTPGVLHLGVRRYWNRRRLRFSRSDDGGLGRTDFSNESRKHLVLLPQSTG